MSRDTLLLAVALRLIFSGSALSLPVFAQVREDIVDSRLQGLDGAAYLAQLGSVGCAYGSAPIAFFGETGKEVS